MSRHSGVNTLKHSKLNKVASTKLPSFFKWSGECYVAALWDTRGTISTYKGKVYVSIHGLSKVVMDEVIHLHKGHIFKVRDNYFKWRSEANPVELLESLLMWSRSHKDKDILLALLKAKELLRDETNPSTGRNEINKSSNPKLI